MMLTIYAVPISLYCAKLRIVLRHKQLEWTEVPPPGGYGSKEYKALVPAGSLPALDHDGFLIGDSEAIAEYLNETFPIPDMLDGSAQKRAKIRELSRFHDTRWEPSVRALFPLIATANRDEVTLQQNWAAMVNRLEQMTPLLPDHAGDLTLADCGLVITGLWVKELAAHFGFTNPVSNLLCAHLDQVSAHQAVAIELADYRPKLNSWLNAQ